MKTRSTMLSSLAIAALATVTLNSTEALAKGGMSGMGGSSGMRSFSVVRTPIAVTKIKALNTTPTYKKLTTTTVVRDHRKLTTATTVVRDHRDDSNVVVRDHRNLDPTKLPPGNAIFTPPAGTATGTAPGGVTVTPTPGGTIHLPPGGLGGVVGGVLNPPTTNPGGTIHPLPPGGVIQVPPGVLNPPGGVVTLPPGTIHPLPPGGVVTLPPGTIHPLPPGGGIIVDPGPGKLPPIEPPPVKNPPVVVVTPPVSVGVAAPVAVEAPGCVYEKSVRKLPDGGLQRVIVKVCPDVVVQ
jgi:hypothetical protein